MVGEGGRVERGRVKEGGEVGERERGGGWVGGMHAYTSYAMLHFCAITIA